MSAFVRDRSLPSEYELQRNLSDAWITRTGDAAERSRGEITHWIRELRMVEHVEELHSQLCGQAFFEFGRLYQGEIGID